MYVYLTSSGAHGGQKVVTGSPGTEVKGNCEPHNREGCAQKSAGSTLSYAAQQSGTEAAQLLAQLDLAESHDSPGSTRGSGVRNHCLTAEVKISSQNLMLALKASDTASELLVPGNF